MDKYDLKLKKIYAEMRQQEQQMTQKQKYTCVKTDEPEKKSSVDQPEQIPMFQITQTLQSMIKIIRTQHKRINDLEKLLHTDSDN